MFNPVQNGFTSSIHNQNKVDPETLYQTAKKKGKDNPERCQLFKISIHDGSKKIERNCHRLISFDPLGASDSLKQALASESKTFAKLLSESPESDLASLVKSCKFPLKTEKKS